MLLSRFWYVFLAVAAAAAAAAALLAQSVINARSDEALADSLARDRVMIDAMLRLEARSRLDRIAFITVDSKLGGVLRAARDVTDEKKLRELNAQAKELMHGHVSRIVEAAGDDAGARDKQVELTPDIAFALDADGRIIAQLGPLEANPPGASIATFPLVKRALQGYLRDDVWVYDRHVYRMAARPVMFGTEYAGAIVHGYRLEKGLTEKLSKNLGGATVAFFYGNDVLGVYIPSEPAGAPQQAELASALPKVLADKDFQAGGGKGVVSLQNGGRAAFMPVTGAAAAAGVGYAIARPRKLLTSPEQLFQQASQDEVRALPYPLLGGGALLLALIGLLSLYLERDRHMKAMLKKTAEIGAGTRERLIVTEWRGAYRTLADRINQAIDKEVEKAGVSAPSTRRKANLDEILGPTPEASATPFFGFASDGDAPAAPAAAPPAPPAAKPGSAPQRTRAQAPAGPPSPPPGGIPSLTPIASLSPAAPVAAPPPPPAPRAAAAAGAAAALAMEDGFDNGEPFD
jgi:hypothetical protein